MNVDNIRIATRAYGTLREIDSAIETLEDQLHKIEKDGRAVGFRLSEHDDRSGFFIPILYDLEGNNDESMYTNILINVLSEMQASKDRLIAQIEAL